MNKKEAKELYKQGLMLGLDKNIPDYYLWEEEFNFQYEKIVKWVFNKDAME